VFSLAEGGVTRCTITNLRPGSLTIAKLADPADGTDFPFTTTTTGTGLADFTLDVDPPADPDGTNADVITFTDLTPGVDYSVTEQVPDGWELTDAQCEGGAATSVDAASAGVTVDLRPGEDVVCTFSDVEIPVEPTTATLIIAKLAAPRDSTTFTFGVTGPGLDDTFTLDNDPIGEPDATNPASIRLTELPPGAYAVTEVQRSGWLLDRLTCDGVEQDPPTASVDLVAGETVVCSFTNIELATLTVSKVTDPAGGTDFPFTVSTVNQPITLDDGQSQTLSGLVPGQYAVTEIVPDGWAVADIDCTGGLTEPGAGHASIVVNLGAGNDATCSFSDVALASIEVTKRVLPEGVAVPQGGFGFDVTGNGQPDGFLTDGQTTGRADLPPGTYTIDELVPAGWVVDIACSGSAAIDTDELAGSAEITVMAGQSASCTWTNTKLGEITIIKDSRPNDPQDIAFTAAYDRVAPIPFALDDDGDPVDDVENGLLPDRATAEDLRPGLYTITENVPAGWTLELVSCTGAELSTVDASLPTLIIRLAAAESITCTFANDRQIPPTSSSTVPTTTSAPTTTTQPPPTIDSTTTIAGGSGVLPPTGGAGNVVGVAAALAIAGLASAALARRRPGS
jgi:hypothetical protein